MVILALILLIAAVHGCHALFRRITNPALRIRVGYGVVAAHTLLYWVWEAQASGNIRSDVVIIYPYLAATYVMYLWPRMGWWAVPAMLALTALNVAFAFAGYALLGKPPG